MTKKADKKKKVDSYLKYSGLAFQMAGVIFISLYVGQLLDERLNTPKPYITMLFMIVFFSAFMYKLIKDLS